MKKNSYRKFIAIYDVMVYYEMLIFCPMYYMNHPKLFGNKNYVAA